MKNSTKLSEKTFSCSQAQIIKTGLFNNYGIKAFTLTAGNKDTTFDYWLYTDQKVNKKTITAIENFILGICYCVL